MEKTYKTVGEVKERISALFKEGYLFTDIIEKKFYFVHHIGATGRNTLYTVIFPTENYFIEREKMVYVSAMCKCEQRKLINSYKILKEEYIPDILDFYTKYGIFALLPRMNGHIDFQSQPNDPWTKIMNINDNSEIQLSEEILGEIFFARNIIEEYARKGIYDILRECCEMPQN